MTATRARTTHVPRRVGGSAVVIGASMAGLCAARVLSDHFDRVEVLDRDTLPDDPSPRALVPQGRHPHLLLVTGARLLDGWFPGIVDEMEGEGAVDVDICRDLYWYQGGGVVRRPASSLHGPAMSRPFLERTVRRRVEALANVTIRGQVTVQGLTSDTPVHRITGIRLDGGSEIRSDLVVDATGRQARSLGWLDQLGFQPPAVSTVAIDTRYVTQLYRRAPAPGRDWKAAGVIDGLASKRLALVLPIEGERWIVVFIGLHGESPPTDHSDRLAYARTFPSPAIAQLMEACEPIGETVTHRFPASQRRHVERLRRFPLGWVLLGDAVGSFNPIYGQGMTSAAMQAEALGACLRRSGRIDRSFARRYFKAASRVVALPWSIAVGADFAYPETTGNKPVGTDLVNRYMDRVTIAAHYDDAVSLRFAEVVSFLRRPESLMAPAFALRVLRTARRGPAGLTTADQDPPGGSTAVFRT